MCRVLNSRFVVNKGTYNKEYYETHKSQYSLHNKNYYDKNRDELLETHKKYRSENIDKMRSLLSRWRNNNRDKWNVQNRERYKKCKDALLKALGDKCVRCGFADVRALQIDHINGGGGREIRKMGPYLYVYYLNHPEEAKEKLQLLCANCNWIKRWEKNEVRSKYLF